MTVYRLFHRCISGFCQGLFLVSGVFATPVAVAQNETNEIVLTGHDLTTAQVASISRSNSPVQLNPEAMERVRQSYQLIVAATTAGAKIYGVNFGVGQNKDRAIFTGSILDHREESEKFNERNLRTTSAGTGPELDEGTVRAAMAIRLNGLLVGASGARPEVASMYAQFLNLRITPLIPSTGSVGEGDISILSHIGLAMMGEGEVLYKGRRLNAAEALKQAKLQPLRPFARDSLAIMSSNAYNQALATRIVEELTRFNSTAELVFALSLEGINGNISPFLPTNQELRKFHHANGSSSRILRHLKGSYLNSEDSSRALQDPLSYRTAAYHFGGLSQTLETLKTLLTKDLNSSSDNPAIVVGVQPRLRAGSQEKSYYIQTPEISGAIIPSAGFEPFPWSLHLDSLKNALNQLTIDSAQRTLKLDDPNFTHLERFLSAGNGSLGFSASQKVLAQLVQQNQKLATPNINTILSMAGGIEDVATNAPQSATELLEMIKNANQVLAIEALHAAQAIDLRLKSRPDLAQGKQSARLQKALREAVPFLDEDRALSGDFLKAAQVLTTLSSDLYHRPSDSTGLRCDGVFL
ncbi:MAG: aromatic amino acid lyase [Bdellovibrio sp.]|nr:aromatic amino acid lyase [Bdellovibrio sp.]